MKKRYLILPATVTVVLLQGMTEVKSVRKKKAGKAKIAVQSGKKKAVITVNVTK